MLLTVSSTSGLVWPPKKRALDKQFSLENYIVVLGEIAMLIDEHVWRSGNLLFSSMLYFTRGGTLIVQQRCSV